MNRYLTATVMAAALFVAACGTDAAEGPETTAAPAATADEFPVTLATLGGELVIEARPKRIVSLSPTATEMLFAIGAGEQVIAVDELSDFPAGAPVTDLSGFTPNLEAISSFDPDLVVMQFDPDGELVPGLDAIGITALVQPAALTLDDTYLQIEQLGTATGHTDEASGLVDDLQVSIEEIVASTSTAAGLTYYHELDDTLFSVTSGTFIGQLYSLLGLENIADGADPDGFGFPQLSAEYIIEQDPDLIFLADTICCAQSAAAIAARPGWGSMSAVVNGAIAELDDSVASRWGPRIVNYLEVISSVVADLDTP